MNNIPRQQLQALLTQQAHAVCYDPNQCESRLRELCPEYPREINLLISALKVLISALKENVMPEELLVVSEDTSKNAVLSKLAQRFNNLGMAPEEAQWAVESWVLALGVIESAMPTPLAQNTPQITPPKPQVTKKSQLTSNKQWWQQWDKNWKRIFKNAIQIDREPNDQELTKILELSELNCTGFKITSLEPVRHLKNLRDLDIFGTQISSLEPLRELTNLQKLYCGLTQVSSLEPLRELTNLQALNCGSTKISHLEPLRELTNLQAFYCYDTEINSLEPLHELKNLRKLDCNDTKLSRHKIKQFQKAVPQCQVKCYENWLALLYIFLVLLILFCLFWIVMIYLNSFHPFAVKVENSETSLRDSSTPYASSQERWP
jgi:hypothetical protein